MEENKFEKQVQQKMDELKITPSDSVWEKIEVRIEKKKRSNRGLILFLLLFCVFLAGGYLLWNTDHRSVTADNSPGKNNTNKNNPGKTTPEISTKEDKAMPPEVNSNRGSANQTADAAGNGTLKKKVTKNPSQYYNASNAKKINFKINRGEKSRIISSQQNKLTEDISGKTKTKPGIVQSREIQSTNEKIREKPEDSAYEKVKTDLSPKPVLKDEVTRLKDTSRQEQKTTATVIHKKNKWRPGLLFSAGISGVGNDFLGLVNSPAADLSNVYNPGTTQGTPLYLPSKTRSEFGFIAGVFAEKNISVRTRLLLGINFKSFSNSNIVGIRNDTTGLYNSLSGNNINNTYKNHYNFIEFPVGLKVEVGRSKSLPLFWQGELLVSQLISSNALQFNRSSGYYYIDNSIFNKTQIGLNTSFSVELFSKHKNSILIGPYFYYSASRLANEGLYNKKHFVFTGLRTEIIFGK